ncbi:WD40-repeat-containing domain protein [Ganoderma leucocontextum]|nr:WD40-repeat-containing domain protein [Ganoderma leucocontextum]
MSDTDIDSSAYVEVRTFTSGHCDTVNVLSFSPDGTYLASGGDDCSLLVWNVLRERLIFRILFNGPVSCIVWHPIHADTLIVGCDDGKIVQMYDFTLVGVEQHDIRIGVRSEVHCLEYDARTRCLAIGIGNEVHVTREQDRNTYSGDIILPAPPDHGRPDDDENRLRAVSVHFINDGQQVVVLYLVHGIICYSVQNGEQLWAIASPEVSRIGSSALSSDGKALIAYSFDRGVHLYSLVSHNDNPIGTYKLEQAPRTKHRVQVAFVQKDRGIVCGTTTGSVCMWYRESREIFQKLHHAGSCSASLARIYIATGSVEQGQATKIKLWRAKMSEFLSAVSSFLPDTV